tara:strand:+ start:495 stop:1019 length:525 start_codon:yes stop_codon:yes gene_type:complete
MIINTLSKYCIFLILALFTLNSCANRGDARKIPPAADDRVAKNVAEGRGFRVMDKISNRKKTNFEFASSNELWRASLDVIDFMPLTSANYSGGIIITDWYSENENTSESIKLVIRFLTNEIRSDAIDLKIFYKNCSTVNNCKVAEKVNDLNIELKKEILKRASLYKKETKEKKN